MVKRGHGVTVIVHFTGMLSPWSYPNYNYGAITVTVTFCNYGDSNYGDSELFE